VDSLYAPVHNALPPSLNISSKDSSTSSLYKIRTDFVVAVPPRCLLHVASLEEAVLLLINETGSIIYIHERCISSQQKMVADQKLEKNSLGCSYRCANGDPLALLGLPEGIKLLQ
jgi:hypothetical protein